MKFRYKKIYTNNKSCYELQVEFGNQWNNVNTSGGQKYFTEREIKDIKEHKKEYKLFWRRNFFYIWKNPKNLSHAIKMESD